MVGLLSAVNKNTRVIFKKPKFKQTIYQLPSMTLKPLAMLSRITWNAEIGACPHFLSKFLNNSSFTAYVSTMTNNRFNGNLHKILFTNYRRHQLT